MATTYHFFDIFTALGAVPDKSWIGRFFVRHHWRVTFLVIEILAAVTLHKFVAALLVEGFADAAGAVVQTL